MPFVNRFASSVAPPPRFGFIRNHPVIVASSAATAGVLMGGFVAVQLLATPAKVDVGATPPASQATVNTKPAPPPPIAETTESAPAAPPASDTVAAADCDKQTWPNLSRECMKNGGTRVSSTDRRDKATGGAIEASAPHGDAAKPATAPAAPPATAPATTVATPPPAVTTAIAHNPPSASPAMPEQPAKTAAVTPESAMNTAPAAKSDPVVQPASAAARPNSKSKPKSKYAAKKSKHKPAKQEFDDDNGIDAVASEDSDERGSNLRDRRDRSRRVVQRWIERDYGDDDGPRRTVVIRRGDGIFGTLFGNDD